MSGTAIAVLLSVGRNPVSGRSRAADRDARAVAVALETGREVVGFHAGRPDECLRAYLGMGLSRVVASGLDPHDDAIPALAALLGNIGPVAAVLAGARAERGDGSGLVPYGVAAELGLPVLPGVMAVEFDREGLRAVQTLPGGRRRMVASAGPIVGTVDLQGPAVRQVARGPAARGRIEVVPLYGIRQDVRLSPAILDTRPARPRPKRIGPEGARSQAGQRLMVRPGPREAALEILAFLEAERIVAPARSEPVGPAPEGHR